MLNQDKGKYWCRSSLHSIYQYNGSSGNNEKEAVNNEMKHFLNKLFLFSEFCDFTKNDNHQYRRYHITDFNKVVTL